jgi:hypothetical protein
MAPRPDTDIEKLPITEATTVILRHNRSTFGRAAAASLIQEAPA